MAVTPKGSPAWSRTSDHSFYGGHTEKQNYLSQGTIDPLTDMSAEDITRMAADLAAVVRTAPFAVLTLQMDDTTPDDPTVEACNLMTGVRSTSYAGDSPPTGFPTAIRQGNGHVRLTFASSYSDEYSQSASFAIKHAKVSAHGTTAITPTYNKVNDTTLDVYTFVSSSGAAATDTKVTVRVW